MAAGNGFASRAVEAINKLDVDAFSNIVAEASGSGSVARITANVAASEGYRESFEANTFGKLPKNSMFRRLALALAAGLAGGLLLTSTALLAQIVGVVLLVVAAFQVLKLASDLIDKVSQMLEKFVDDLF